MSSFLVVSAFLILILVVNHQKRVTLVIKRFSSIVLSYFMSCLDILVSKVLRRKPTLSKHLLRVRR